MSPHLSSVALALSAVVAAGTAPESMPSERRSPVVRVVEMVSPAVVNISTEQRVDNPFHRSGVDRFFSSFYESAQGQDPSGPAGGQGGSLGSGVIIDPRGYILTNEHVLWRASRVRAVLSDGRVFEAEVVGVDPRSDLAVLKVESERPLPAASLGDDTDLLIGETVIAIGNSYGLSNSVTTGVLSAVKRSIRAGDRIYSDFIQTDASINPGNSGGALLNVEGELIGINTAVLGEGHGVGFAIPAGRARKVFDDLVRYGEVRAAWLGLDVKDLSDREFAELAWPSDAEGAAGAVAIASPGAPVRRVYVGGAAEKAGLTAGDLVTKLGPEKISSRTDFETAASRLKSGDKVSISYRRGTAERQAELAATEFPMELAEDYLADQVGLECTDISAGIRQRAAGLPPDGVIVTQVRNRSRGFFSGLVPGDILRGIDQLPVKDMAGLRKAVPRLVGRDAVLLLVVRGRYQYRVTIDLT